MDAWISVKDALPNEGQLVVAAHLYDSLEPDAAVCLFFKGRFMLWRDGLEVSAGWEGGVVELNIGITHWTSLPPYTLQA